MSINVSLAYIGPKPFVYFDGYCYWKANRAKNKVVVEYADLTCKEPTGRLGYLTWIDNDCRGIIQIEGD